MEKNLLSLSLIWPPPFIKYSDETHLNARCLNKRVRKYFLIGLSIWNSNVFIYLTVASILNSRFRSIFVRMLKRKGNRKRTYWGDWTEMKEDFSLNCSFRVCAKIVWFSIESIWNNKPFSFALWKLVISATTPNKKEKKASFIPILKKQNGVINFLFLHSNFQIFQFGPISTF